MKPGHFDDLPRRTDIRRILVIKWSAMGDVVIASTVMEDVFRAFPGREIHLNTLPSWRPLFQHDPRFSEIYATDMRARGLRGVLHWLRHVRRNDYDLIIDFQSNQRTRLLLALLVLTGARVPFRVGNHPVFPYNIFPRNLPPVIAAFEHLRSSLRAAGIPTVTPRPVLHPAPAQRERVGQLLRQHAVDAGRYALFLPGCSAAGHLKRWGSERFISLAMQLRDAGMVDKVVLVGARDELDECNAIAAACGPWAVNLCGQTQVLEIVPLAEGARLVVGNDTGTAHVASTTDRPMVVICGPTDPRRVKPIGDNVVAEQAQIWCINCYRKECTHHSCMMLISPEHVLATLRSHPALAGA